jgi:hypothetical protein
MEASKGNIQVRAGGKRELESRGVRRLPAGEWGRLSEQNEAILSPKKKLELGQA